MVTAVEQLEYKMLGSSESTQGVYIVENDIFPRHKDNDSFYSTLMVLKKDICSLDDSVVAYFCFHNWGMLFQQDPEIS